MVRVLFLLAGSIMLLSLVAAAATTDAAPAMRPAGDSPAKGAKHRVVFEVTMDGQERWEAVLNNVENMRKALGEEDTQVEVVAHGAGLGMLMASNEKQKDRMRTLAGSGVVFGACENTMKRKNVSKEDLLPFAITVDSGVAEVVRKQEQGWSYLKSGG